jgi:hypothetical protein
MMQSYQVFMLSDEDFTVRPCFELLLEENIDNTKYVYC